MDPMTWLLFAGVAVGVTAGWYSWKRRQQTEKKDDK